VSALTFATVLVLIGLSAAGCLEFARRNARWRRAAVGGAMILSIAALEACAIYLDVHDVLEP
jgi:cytochrome c biogenesis protein CcdA